MDPGLLSASVPAILQSDRYQYLDMFVECGNKGVDGNTCENTVPVVV